MKKNKKANLPLKQGTKKNKKIYITIIVITIIIIGISTIIYFTKDNKKIEENTRYFTGNLYTANHAANLLDYAYNNKNIIISPLNLNSSLAIIYNATDNNSTKELKSYFKTTPTKLNEELKIKLNTLEEPKKEETNFDKLYKSYIKKFYDNSYDNLTISAIDLLSTQNREELLLLIRKIILTYSRIEGLNSYTEKEIKNYKLTSKETKYSGYTIKQEIDKILDYNESYNIKNEINNYTEIYINNIDINDDYLKKTEIYNYKITPLKEEISTNVKTINDNIKLATSEKISRVVSAADLEENNIMLINSLYFNYEWDESFSKLEVKDTEFYHFNDENEIVEMMYDVESKYYENNYALAFSKDFENKKYSFVGILPKETDEFSLSSLDIDSLLNSEKKSNVYIGIPKISYQSEIDLIELLKNQKIKEIFTDNANLTQLTSDKTKISKYTQKIGLTIAERGTIESTITTSELESNTEEEYSESIILNRPFAYLIRNNETNEIIMIGKVININESN